MCFCVLNGACQFGPVVRLVQRVDITSYGFEIEGCCTVHIVYGITRTLVHKWLSIFNITLIGIVVGVVNIIAVVVIVIVVVVNRNILILCYD